MKTFMLIIDGISDDPMSELEDRTPLEFAVAPYMEYLACCGERGTIQTAFKGYPVESLICIMGLLGYDPQQYYPCGRSSFEALARGISLGENDLVFRCNIINVASNHTSITDFTAGMISDTYAKKILSRIKLPSPTWELYPGQSYRNILIIRQASVQAHEIKLFEPHMHHGESLENILPIPLTANAENLVTNLRDFLLDSYRYISEMDLDAACKGNMLWFWSPSSKPSLPSFKSKYGLSGAIVAGLDFMHGLAMAADMYFEVVPGATGYIDTNYEAKAKAAIKLLETHDFVLTHINATDEAAHMQDGFLKASVIEKVDRYVLEPVFHYLHHKQDEKFSIVVCGDHKTRCHDGRHIGDPVPFFCYRNTTMRENICNKIWIDKPIGSNFVSLDFMNQILNEEK